MDGFKKNIDSVILAQWYQLFARQGVSCSSEAYTHWQQVKRLGIPNNKQESWKYTPLDKLLQQHFSPAEVYYINSNKCNSLSLDMDSCRMVFINGCFASWLSEYDTSVWQVILEKGNARQKLPAPIQAEVFLHLTESLSQEATRIFLSSGTNAKRPLYLLHINCGSNDKNKLSTINYLHYLYIGEGAQARVVEHFISLDEQVHFTGARISMVISNNAKLNHIKLAFENHTSYHFGHNDIRVGHNSVVNSHSFILGANLTRHQTSAQLNGERSELKINSLIMPFGKDISDSRTYLEHNKGHCLSRQLHKIIACGHGKGAFNGLVKVAKHAVKTDGHLVSNNLLLDYTAEINSKPHLEIYTDDIKCSHGSTVGRIDKQQLFYLQSRGIAQEEAQKMIVYAFAIEVAELVSNNKVREAILTRIRNTLKYN